MNASISARDARAALLAEMGATEKRLELDGISTAVLIEGAGAPVILLHGPGEHALKWFTILPDLAATNTVIAPDLPGHGETEVREGNLDVERVLSWLDALIEATCAEPPVLAGQVIGGAIALRYAARHPHRVARLVLIDTLGLVPFSPEPAFGSAIMNYLAQPDDATYEKLWDQCATDPDAVRQQMGDGWQLVKRYNLNRMGEPSLQPHFHALMRDFGFPAIDAAELARNAVPTSLIWGRDDRATRVQVAQTASARYGWPLHIIDRAGADPELEQPTQFMNALRAQTARVATASV